MKFYLAEASDSDFESTRTFNSLKDAKDYARSCQEVDKPYPMTIYKMDVSVNRQTIESLICGIPCWNERTAVFEIGFDEEIELARQRLEADQY